MAPDLRRTTTLQMPAANPTAPRRRNRKRKRRQASSSSSSSSSDSIDSSSDGSEVPKKTHVKEAPSIKPEATRSSPSPALSSTSSSTSDSEGGDDDDDAPVAHPASSSAIPQRTDSEPAKTRERDRHRSPSPSPPPADAPPFLPPAESNNRAEDEQALRNRFRQFWMASVADAFADDLEQIRQVRVSSSTAPPSRLSENLKSPCPSSRPNVIHAWCKRNLI